MTHAERRAERLIKHRLPPGPSRTCNSNHCKNEAAPNRRACQKHLDANRAHAKARMHRKMAAGECLDCAAPVMLGRRRCAVHLYKSSDAVLALRGGRVREYLPRGAKGDVYDVVYKAPLTKADRKLMTMGRCGCGLLLPCYDCGPTARELATSRPGAE